MLNTIFDCSFDSIKPTLEIPKELNDTNQREECLFTKQFSKMNIKNKNVFEAHVVDDETNESTLSDFHLAATDLIKYLIRTNI